jgi:hypothetical protein
LGSNHITPHYTRRAKGEEEEEEEEQHAKRRI